MTLSEAHAYHADLLHLPAAPEHDHRALEALARWLTRFSPNVSPCPPDAIFLDATGMERLYGGPAVLAPLVNDALVALRINVRVAVAPTVGAAWALAKFGANQSPIIVNDRAGILDVTASLPPEALRVDSLIARTLRTLGVTTIAHLLRLPRDQLAVRFGADVLRRIDQLTGSATEPLTFLEHRTPVAAAIAFDGVVHSLEMIHVALRQLVIEVCATLSDRGLGARELRITLSRPYAPAVERSIRITRPSRSVAGFCELLRCGLESTCDDRGDGFLGVRLDVSQVERLVEAQTVLVGDDGQRAAGELAHLVERLHARFDACMEWPALVESRMPERAVKCADAPACEPAPVRLGSRPTRLLREPEELRVMVMPSESLDGLPISMTRGGQVQRLTRARGPERIAGEWWDGRGKTRDYFDAEDEAGRRYWLFRVLENGRWFLHGIFE
jgi:protein ImuB